MAFGERDCRLAITNFDEVAKNYSDIDHIREIRRFGSVIRGGEARNRDLEKCFVDSPEFEHGRPRPCLAFAFPLTSMENKARLVARNARLHCPNDW